MGIIQNAVLHALHHAIDQGERHAAVLALRGLDPFVRWRARGELLAALRFADLATAVASEPHRMRVAGLRACRKIPDSGFEDEALVQAEFEQLLRRAPAPRPGPRLLVGSAGAIAAALLAMAALRHFTAPFDPRGAQLGELLGPTLTEYFVQVPRSGSEERAALRERLIASAGGVLPADAVGALDRTLVAMNQVLAANDAEAPAGADLLHAAVNGAVAFDAALAVEQQPYFVDLDWLQRGSRTVPFLFTFYVEREREILVGDQSVRVVHLWRLDSLSIEQGYLGYTRPHTPAALVLLDQVEADLIADVLPVLPEEETMDLVDFATRRQGKAWIAEVERSTAAAVRRHFAELPVQQQARYRDVGALLAERRKLVRKWQETLNELGAALVVPVRLIPEADYLGELELKVPREQLRQWEALHAGLLQRETHQAFAELRDNFVDAVERHEVQHRIDYRRELFEVPEILVRRLQLDNPLAAEPGSLAGRARDEFSAYLATVASAEPTPLLDLALLARFLFNRQNFAGAYTYAATAVYEAIAQELNIAPSAREARVLGRAQLAELVTAVLAQKPEALRKAARSAYHTQIGEAVAQVQRGAQRQNEPWRH
jgi:hypothetical protein